MLENRAGSVVDDGVLRRAAIFEGEVELRQRELDADDVGLQHAERRLEELLARLVAAQDHDRSRVHGAAV